MHRALEINPLSHNFLADLGQIHYFAHEYDEAKKYCFQALEIYPDFLFAHQYLYYIYLKTGENDSAIEEIIKAERINGSLDNLSAQQKERLEAVFEGYRKSYRHGGIKEFLDAQFAGTTQNPDSFYLYAMKHAIRGENEKALDYLERANEERTFLSAFVKAEPIFDSLHNDDRFLAILQKVNLNN